MSGTSNSQEKVKSEDSLISLLGKCLDVLRNGTDRVNLIRKIDRLINKTHTPDKVSTARQNFLNTLTKKIHGLKVYSVSRCCLFVYRIWEKLDPHKEQQELLESIAWYSEPNRWRLEMDKRRSGKPWDRDCKPDYDPSATMIKCNIPKSPAKESKPNVHVRRIVVRSTTMDSSRVKRSSLVRDEEYEIRERIINRQKEAAIVNRNIPSIGSVNLMDVRSTVQVVKRSEVVPSQSTSSANLRESSESDNDHYIGPLSKRYQAAEKERNKTAKIFRIAPKPLFACIDLEGTTPNIAEVAVLLCNADEIIEARVFHIKVPFKSALHDGTKYCHGIHFDTLKSIAKWTEDEARAEVKTWLESQMSIVTVVSADEGAKSDVSQFVEGMRVIYVNFPLPRWEERLTNRAHILAQSNRPEVIKVKEATCPYAQLHRKELLGKKKKRLSLTNGPHCGLSDILELFLHLKYNFLWSVVARLAATSPVPHRRQC